jgi:hypothetical protein
MRKLASWRTPPLILVLTLVSIGCGSGQESMTLPALEGYGMNLIDEDALGGAYIDIRGLRGDEDLAAVLDSFSAETFNGELEDLGIELSQIDTLVSSIGEDRAGICYGRFEFDVVRASLRELDLTHGSYEGVEFWSGEYEDYRTMGVAFLANGLIWGDRGASKSLIRTIEGSEASLHETPEVGGIIERLPEWAPLMAMVSLDPLSKFGLLNAEAAGYFLAKEDKDSLKVALVVKCKDSATAQEMLEFPTEVEGLDARRDGSWFIAEYRMSVDSFGQMW